MFYPQQFIASTEQYQQEQQQRKELELLLLKQHLQQHLLSTPPPSPMSATLGHPNRSCVSCKKRKVKCDRKTPSCTACQKSKHRCHYTSYSPPVLTEEPQQPDEDEGIKAIRQKIEELDNTTRLRWERFQKMMSAAAYQPSMAAKDERDLSYQNPPAPYYIEDDEVLYNLNLNNPMIPTSTGATPQQFALQQGGSPQQVAQQLQLSPQPIHMSAQQPQVSYLLPHQYQQHPNSAETSPFNQPQNLVLPSGNYSPYMKGTIVLNYNLNGMRPFLGRQMVPILQSMTGGSGPMVPPSGFNDVAQLQNWLREKFLSQDWSEEMETYSVVDPDERFELRPVYEDVNHHFSVRQKFEVILHRAELPSSPSSVHGGDFQAYDYEDKHNMEIENLTNYSETGSNRSSVIDFDPTDIFLNKIYAFVRRFIRNVPWLRENFLTNRAIPSSMGLDAFNDGVFSDVVVEVRKISSYAPYQDLKLVPNNHEEFIKGRLFF